MKRIFFSAALVLTLSGAALAQAPQQDPAQQAPAPVVRQHHEHQHNPQHEANHLAKALNLTPDQAAKLEPILANREQQMQAIHANGQLTQQDARQQMRALHQSTEQQLAGVLTPDQLQQMKAMRHHGPHGPHGYPNQGAPAAPPSA